MPRGRVRLLLVRQRLVLEQTLCDVDAEAVDAAVEPEAQHLLEVPLHGLVVPVEVGLLGSEDVQVVLAAAWVELPRRAPEGGRPRVRRAAVAAGAEEVAPAIRVARVGECVAEPLVLLRGVIGDDVHEHPQAEHVGVCEERVEVGERPEARVDVRVVGDVVAVVGTRRGVERRQPDRVDAEIPQIAEPRTDSGEVAEAVAVGVGEAADVDLVEDGVAPPHGATSYVPLARPACTGGAHARS